MSESRGQYFSQEDKFWLNMASSESIGQVWANVQNKLWTKRTSLSQEDKFWLNMTSSESRGQVWANKTSFEPKGQV